MVEPGKEQPDAPSPRVPGERLFLALPWLCRWQTATILYVALALGASLQQLLRSGFTDFGIFQQSFVHLLNGSGLYLAYPAEQSDLFKYSPTFALFMAPFWLAPKWLALPAWNLLNAICPLVAVHRLALSPKEKAFILLFVAIELLGSIQNSESNGIVAGLMIGAFAALEKDRPLLAALLVCLNLYIKIFGVAVAIMFVLYEHKRTFLTACAVFGLGLGLLPGLVAGADGLAMQYEGWLNLLRQDQLPNNLSLVGFTEQWVNVRLPHLGFLCVGVLILLASLLRRSRWGDESWRLRFLSSLLMWVVIFNHKAESPTFIIAALGAAIWGVLEPPSMTRSVLLVLTFVLTSLSSTDLFPKPFRQAVLRPLGVKAVPIFVVWAHDVLRLALGTRRFRNGGASRQGPGPAPPVGS